MDRKARITARFALLCLIVALPTPFFHWAYEQRSGFGHFFRSYGESVVYSVIIGLLLTIAMPRVWIASCKWSMLLRWGARAGTVLAGTAVGCFLTCLVFWGIYGRDYDFWPSYVVSLKISVIFASLAVFTLVAYERVTQQLRVTETQLKTKELERERALKLATEARLSSLESRLHPHFLFNTINSIASLIHEEPVRAETLLNQMAELLRFSLDSTQGGLVPLARELKILNDYLDIEKARFNERLRYEIATAEELEDVLVPPLSLQTLVENSVKYAVSTRRTGAKIHIICLREGERLLLEVQDDGPGFRNLMLPSGHGLNNLQERLTALFGETARLNITSTPEGASVEIDLPLLTNAVLPKLSPVENAPIAARP